MQNHQRVGLTCAWALLALIWLALPVTAQMPVPQRNGFGEDRSSKASDQKLASVLFYNFYTSDAAAPDRTDTLVTLTNTNSMENVAVHLFFVMAGGGTGDAFTCLAANQSINLRASVVDPGATGHIMAIAVDQATGWPISFNYLTGSASVKMASGHAGTLAAIGFAALYQGALPGYHRGAGLAALPFDGRVYDAMPRRVLLNNVPSVADGYATRLVLNHPVRNLMTGEPITGFDFGLYYDETGRPYSFAVRALPQVNQLLSDEFPRSSPLFSQAIPAGKRANLNINALRDGVGLLGAVFYYHSNAATQAGLFSGGAANLHSMETTSVTITKPVLPPIC